MVARNYWLVCEMIRGQRDIDLSNSRRTRPPTRRLTTAEVFDRVERFLRTRDPKHLPRELRPEAEGILAWAAEGAQRFAREGPPPWPESAGPQPPPGAPMGDAIRALLGDDRADADSGLTP